MKEEDLATILEKLCTYSIPFFLSHSRPFWLGKQNSHTLCHHSPFVSFSPYLLLGTKEWVQAHPHPITSPPPIDQSNQLSKFQQQTSIQEITPTSTTLNQSINQQDHQSSRNPTTINALSGFSDTHRSAVHVVMEPEPTVSSQTTIIPSPSTSEIASRALQTRMAIWGTVCLMELIIAYFYTTNNKPLEG